MSQQPQDQQAASTRPYMIRALHEWCTDNGYTPYIAVAVDDLVRVPREFVRDGEIVFNIAYEATSKLQLGNEWIEFSARFGGHARDILVPVDHVLAIYARENGQGMAFPAPPVAAPRPSLEPVPALDTASGPAHIDLGAVPASPEGEHPDGEDPPPRSGGLRRVK